MTQKIRYPDRGLDIGHRGLVDSWGSRPDVPGHAFPRMHEKRRVIDEVEQISEPAGGVVPRPTIQLGLHPPYREVRHISIRPPHGVDVHRRTFGHYVPSLTDTLPSFPMYVAFPCSEYYDGAAPPMPFG